MDEAGLVGQTISHYRITERLGGGGMGIVYKAVDVRLNRFVALKFLSASLTKDPDAKERFIQEAQAASALDHPNICTIHEIDETPDRELFLTMAYYEGETLKHRIERGPLPVEEALDIAVQVAQALSRAHESGIVHRDIKPANLMLPKDGPVKIVDFGLAKLVGHSELTKTGTTVGTVAYMAPEQIRGGEAGPAADVWAVGVVLYQMLAGTRPFEGKDDLAIVSRILDEPPQPLSAARPGLPDAVLRVVARALDKNVSHRYPSATELLTDLKSCRAALMPGQPAPTSIVQLLRRPAVAIAALALVVIATVPTVLAVRRATRARWVREEAVPQLTQLIAKDDYVGAFSLAEDIERYSPNDPLLANLWSQFAVQGSIVTAPDGADVSVQPYAATDDRWTYLGRTPLRSIRLPRVVLKFRIEKSGFEPRLLAAKNPSSLLQNGLGRVAKPITIALVPAGTTPEMVPVPGGAFPVPLSGFTSDALFGLDAFAIDRYEVTNKAFKQFVDSGAYGKPEIWKGLPFVIDGREAAWDEARRRFHDSSDRPGPATWEVGQYPPGQDDYPVGGVSWYEAVAYCRSVGKTLPTVYHWTRAALAVDEINSPVAPPIILASNYGGKGPMRVGTSRGIGPYGTFDMGGNVREWVWNESEGGRRWILGGGWNDPDWMLVQRNSMLPFDRSASDGFRCARYDEAALPPELTSRMQVILRDARTAKAVSNEVYEALKRQFSYAKSPLNERVESTNDSNHDWTRLRISFDAGHDNGRVPIILFLPKNGRPPYQLAMFFPGLGAFAGSASSENLQPQLDFIVKSGRAVVQPIYKGSFERWDTFLNERAEDGMRAIRSRMVEWREEVGRTLDLLSARKDVDTERVAFVGVSFGASMMLPLLDLENRFKTAVLLAPGFTYRSVPPEADFVNYASHVTMPVLMLGGRQDYVLPLEEAQKPLFERLGTPAEHKRHVIFDAGHAADYPRGQVLREVLAWLDKYLGPVKPAG